MQPKTDGSSGVGNGERSAPRGAHSGVRDKIAPFGHAKLIVYQKAVSFVRDRRALLDRVPRRVAACDHLERAAESIPINIAHASSAWSPRERIVYLGHANGSALECAACLDVLVVKKLLTLEDGLPGKRLLAEVVCMLSAMHRTAAGRVREISPPYRTKKGRLFGHEDLDVYQVALDFIAWVDAFLLDSSCSANWRSKLDQSTTAIVLNIAEGNGRFTGAGQAAFYRTAYKATIQSAALVDMATQTLAWIPIAEEGQNRLRRIVAMLAALSKVASHAL